MEQEQINQNLRILLIDDDRVDRRAICLMMSQQFSVVEAVNGQEALAALTNATFDCAILDYSIPGTDTLKLLAQIREHSAVVMLTGMDDAEVAVTAMKAGAQDFLVKGKFTADALHRAIANAVEKMELRRKIEQQRGELELLATTDGLTGLYNRRYFMSALTQEIARMRRTNDSLCLLMLDLDHFKQINDSYGHVVGDEVLIHVSNIIKSVVRRTDCAARYGGEEFCILLIGADIDGAETSANRMRGLIAEKPCTVEKHVLSITCSIGVAELQSNFDNAQQLIDLADQALYQAKHSGRNCVVRTD